MPVIKVLYSPYFVKEFRRLPPNIQQKAIQLENIFKQNPQDLRLKTHPLKGKLVGNFAFSINYHHRIIFYYTAEGDVVFAHIGTHSLYR